MSIILVVFLLVSFGDFPGSLVAVKSGQRQGNGSAVKVTFGSPVSYLPASGRNVIGMEEMIGPGEV